jgi:riboflavin synthase
VFTGLVQEKGRVRSAEGGRLVIETGLGGELSEGDSVAVNGVCLTAVERDEASFAADVVEETLRRSSLGRVGPDDEVNLELPLRAGDRLGGHVVQGHVDGTGTVEAAGERLRVSAPPELLRYVVEKGSIAIDGVSLTVAEVDDEGFSVALIPETLERTTLGALEPDREVNIEVDVLAKHVEKLVASREGV